MAHRFSALAIVTAVVAASSVSSGQNRTTADHYVPSRPETVTWGWIPTDKAPVVTIKSGQTVRMDTLSHHGSTQAQDPDTFLAEYGIAKPEILQDVRDFWASRAGRPRDGRGGAHILTGPVAVTGAEAGDMLEVEVIELSARAPFGVNTTGPTSGVLGSDYPGSRPGDPPLDIPAGTRHVLRTGTVNGRQVVLFSESIHIPFAPFMGIMAVAPRNPVVGEPGVTIAGVQNSTPPGAYGGNMDLRDLGVGSKLYLPVFQSGALFYVGDPHGTQGNGEVSGNALEQSLTGFFRFVLHKGKTISAPRAETATHYILMGIDLDLDRAMRKSVTETVRFLVEEKGLTPAKAFSLASLAVDFQVAEAVDLAQLVSAKIPKSVFLVAGSR